MVKNNQFVDHKKSYFHQLNLSCLNEIVFLKDNFLVIFHSKIVAMGWRGGPKTVVKFCAPNAEFKTAFLLRNLFIFVLQLINIVLVCFSSLLKERLQQKCWICNEAITGCYPNKRWSTLEFAHKSSKLSTAPFGKALMEEF